MVKTLVRGKKIIFSILTATLVGIACFLIAEYGLSRFYTENLEYVQELFEFDQILGVRLKSGNHKFKPIHSLLVHNIYINELGIRNKQISGEIKSSKKRIIILGDSFVFGAAIREDELFSSQLEKILNINEPNKYEVINAGVPSYGTAQELLLMEKLAQNNISGDIYILVMFTNDILDNLRLRYDSLKPDTSKPEFVLSEDNEIELKYPPENFKVRKKKIKEFRIISLLKTRVGTLLLTKPYLVNILVKLGIDIESPRMPGLFNAWYREDVLNRGVPLMKALIKEIKNKAMERNAELYIALVPSPMQVEQSTIEDIMKKSFPDDKAVDDWIKEPTRPQKIIKAICDELMIPFFDLYQVLRENQDKQLFIYGDGHLTSTGHLVVAQSLADFILKN